MSEEELFERLMDQVDAPWRRGRCQEAGAVVGEAVNTACGDQVRLELVVDDGLVKEAWHSGKGCVISQAAASLLARHVEGRPLEELRAFGQQEMLELVGVRLTPGRRRCALLAWEAFRAILDF